ncbi:HAD family hydrolase [uncultured Tateyamaria sp.]|uniref:HAD family hydrolase n=1 Tax=Tateyamaria sp. 1078 TaxID=3417464 RepID=UPI0026020E3E|nr:HAD family hydrolase [uncultured Tateyamaria sp.]
MSPQPILVWDFDGVLNANIVDGRFVWADRLMQDWGVDRDEMAADVFHPDRIGRIMRGQLDLRDVVDDWRLRAGHSFDPDAFLAYWFARDARPDAMVVAHLARPGLRHVIGTNNEARRAAFIGAEMGFGPRVERIFASGLMGCAKPDSAYFEQIEAWSAAPPSAHALIDDTARNVAAAQARGWRAYHFTDATRDGLTGFLETLS